jgi:hypothetical protein
MTASRPSPILQYSHQDLLSLRNFGRRSLYEVRLWPDIAQRLPKRREKKQPAYAALIKATLASRRERRHLSPSRVVVRARRPDRSKEPDGRPATRRHAVIVVVGRRSCTRQRVDKRQGKAAASPVSGRHGGPGCGACDGPARDLAAAPPSRGTRNILSCQRPAHGGRFLEISSHDLKGVSCVSSFSDFLFSSE